MTEILPIFWELLTVPPYYAAISIESWNMLTGCKGFPRLNQEANIPQYGKRLRVIGGELETKLIYVEEVV